MAEKNRPIPAGFGQEIAGNFLAQGYLSAENVGIYCMYGDVGQNYEHYV